MTIGDIKSNLRIKLDVQSMIQRPITSNVTLMNCVIDANAILFYVTAFVEPAITTIDILSGPIG